METLENPAKINDVTVTRYHESNKEDMIRLCKEFSSESLNAYGLGVEADHLMEMIEVCKQAMFFLRINGKVVGVICGTVVANTCNKKPALQEVMWYVEKAHRSHGKILIKLVIGMES